MFRFEKINAFIRHIVSDNAPYFFETDTFTLSERVYHSKCIRK